MRKIQSSRWCRYSMHRGAPPPFSMHPTYLAKWGRHSGKSPPPLPPPPISNYCSFQRLQRIFMTASRRRSRVEKLMLDSYSEHPLLLPFFDRMPRSSDIDRQSLVKIRHWPVTQLRHEEEKISSEKNTSEVREEPATVDFARPKQ
jgi:hypothetical protein